MARYGSETDSWLVGSFRLILAISSLHAHTLITILIVLRPSSFIGVPFFNFDVKHLITWTVGLIRDLSQLSDLSPRIPVKSVV